MLWSPEAFLLRVLAPPQLFFLYTFSHSSLSSSQFSGHWLPTGRAKLLLSRESWTDQRLGGSLALPNLELLSLVTRNSRISYEMRATDPRAPRWVSTFADGGEAYGVSVEGHYLYVADLQDGVEVWDVSDPHAPQKLDGDGQYAPHGIFHDGTYLYLADQDQHFVVLAYDPGAAE